MTTLNQTLRSNKKVMLHYESFKNTVLLSPIEDGADSLKIISGYASPAMVDWHLTAISEDERIQRQIDISLILGMARQDGIGSDTHREYVRLTNQGANGNSKFECSYVHRSSPVHAKLYIWERDGAPFRAFVGSANYSQVAFSPARREILCDCDPAEALAYYAYILGDTVFCNHSEIEEFVTIRSEREMYKRLQAEEGLSAQDVKDNQVTLSLLKNDGEIPDRSGINWGQRDGREHNQAYISLPAEIARRGFFPLDKQHFSVLTDDGHQLILRVEQQNDKAITTPHNNSLIGEYLRNRLGVRNGGFVTKQDLTRYGRTNITFEKIDDEHFYMDFSVNGATAQGTTPVA